MTWRPDLVLVDVLMAGMDGFELCNRIHAVPGLAHILSKLWRGKGTFEGTMNALILAHYYTLPEIQMVADIVGDSLALARAAEKNSAASSMVARGRPST